MKVYLDESSYLINSDILHHHLPLQLLSSYHPVPVKVLILTVHNEVEYLLKAVDIGIDGYLLKDSSYDELKEAIDVVISGNTYIQPSLLPALNESISG